jgi:hypothetical protein
MNIFDIEIFEYEYIHGLFLERVYKIELDTKTEYRGVLGDTFHIPKRVFLKKS